MSGEDVERMRSSYEAWNRRDREAWASNADPNVELIASFMEMEGGDPLKGREGIDRLWDAWHETLPDLRFDVEEIRDLGETTPSKPRGCRSSWAAAC
jgi:hypothetical protein